MPTVPQDKEHLSRTAATLRSLIQEREEFLSQPRVQELIEEFAPGTLDPLEHQVHTCREQLREIEEQLIGA